MNKSLFDYVVLLVFNHVLGMSQKMRLSISHLLRFFFPKGMVKKIEKKNTNKYNKSFGCSPVRKLGEKKIGLMAFSLART